jgi:hypothetical protein
VLSWLSILLVPNKDPGSPSPCHMKLARAAAATLNLAEYGPKPDVRPSAVLFPAIAQGTAG